MCGYAGVVVTDAGGDLIGQSMLDAMGEAIHTRGPDAQGIWQSNDLNVGLVHRRLAIQDLSPLGVQPMHSVSERFTIAFNGEIYNFKTLRDELRQSAFVFRGGSDTEVILAAFEAWGIESALQKFVGMFSIAVIDHHTKTLWLIRDRMGEKPLYYYHHNNQLIFASELKALMACPLFEKNIEPSALALLMRHNYIPAPWTIFKNTLKLEPAHFLKFNLDKLQDAPQKVRYWSPDLQWDTHLTPQDVHEQLSSLLEQSIADQMISDAPLGAFLSGGIDSSTIVALMQKQSLQPVKTFSVGFNVAGFNEAEHAKAVAAHLGTEHTEYYVEPQDALNVIPNLATIYDEPFADSSQIPTYIVSRMTREKVTVALSGDGGDELFAGYSRYATYANAFACRASGLQNAMMAYIPAGLAAGITKVLKSNQRGLTQDQVIEKVLRYRSAYQAKNPRDFYRDQVGFWLNPEHHVDGAQRLNYALDFVDSRSDAIASFQWADINSYLPDDILVKVDRAAMANSLETRVPLLDHRIVELSLKVSTSINVQQGVTKMPLRRILYQYVPQSMVDRPKQGFAVPVAHWLRHELRDWAEELLSESNLAEHGLFKTSLIRAHWLAHLHTEHDYSSHLWSILMFQLWFKKYIR